MILFYAMLSATYATLFVHGTWHAHRHTLAVERGLGRKLKRTWAMYLLCIPAIFVMSPLASVWILIGDLDWMMEAAVDEIDNDGGCTEEEWARVQVELDAYKASLS